MSEEDKVAFCVSFHGMIKVKIDVQLTTGKRVLPHN
jgi:hypothetical protein